MACDTAPSRAASFREDELSDAIAGSAIIRAKAETIGSIRDIFFQFLSDSLFSAHW
jgi:hypothetical protein